VRVIVLGASGMLGSMVLDHLFQNSNFHLVATVRRSSLIRKLSARMEDVEWRPLHADRSNLKTLTAVLSNVAWAVNAIGITKPHIHAETAGEVERAVKVNAMFPHLLAQAAQKVGCRVLQIATDCVYSGRRGLYTEQDEHDPLDVYGKTKSLGEVHSKNVYHLRCSIIGPEPSGHLSLMDWFLRQPPHTKVTGFTNHQWNGITTLHFARICRGVITRDLELPHVQHIVPRGIVSKAQLLQCIAREFAPRGVSVDPANATVGIDRTLNTLNEPLNQVLWEAAGYERPPSVAEMVAELATLRYRFPEERAQ
jgi:dTDP-4-dehydrorhamnose reductase